MKHASQNKVVVLDRDGTIVVDRGYLSDHKGLTLLPGAAHGLHSFLDNGYRLVVITNQSGVGRGMFSLEQLELIHEKFQEMLCQIGVRLTKIYSCPHAPEANCGCRKPRTGLLLRAATELYFDPAAAIVIGDKESDIEMGRRVGATTILISSSLNESQGYSKPTFIARDLCEAARVIQFLPDPQAAISAVK